MPPSHSIALRSLAIESFHLTFKYVFHVGALRRSFLYRAQTNKVRVYVTHPEAAHLVKIHAPWTDHSSLKVDMFEEREAAAKWLDVPMNYSRAHSDRTNVMNYPPMSSMSKPPVSHLATARRTNEDWLTIGSVRQGAGRIVRPAVFNRFTDLSAARCGHLISITSFASPSIDAVGAGDKVKSRFSLELEC